jgi:dinuclear metal center YbgI/SA1388 family protein
MSKLASMGIVGDVLDALERAAPRRYALGFDRIGLQVGDPSAIVDRCVVALDRSLGAIEFAASQGAQMLVTHHPLIFEPLKSVTTATYEGRAVLALLRSGLAFAAAHTNWDAALGGVSDSLARLLDLTDVQSFGMVAEPPEQPISRLGRLAAPMKLAEFARLADERLETRGWVWGDAERQVEKVAIAGGAADSDWHAARQAGADVFLVGEVKQHIALEASESGLAMIASGHYATEQPGALALCARLQEELADVKFELFTPAPGWHGRPLQLW